MQKCECGQATQPLISDHNPRASEWYCSKCHRSFPMSGDDLQQIRMMRGRQHPGDPDALRSP